MLIRILGPAAAPVATVARQGTLLTLQVGAEAIDVDLAAAECDALTQITVYRTENGALSTGAGRSYVAVITLLPRRYHSVVAPDEPGETVVLPLPLNVATVTVDLWPEPTGLVAL